MRRLVSSGTFIRRLLASLAGRIGIDLEMGEVIEAHKGCVKEGGNDC